MKKSCVIVFSLFTLEPELEGHIGLHDVQTFVQSDLTLSLAFVAFPIPGNVSLMLHPLTHNLERIFCHINDY